MQTILIAIAIYFLFRFVFDFMIPVIKVAMGLKKRMDHFNPKEKNDGTSQASTSHYKRTTSGKTGVKEDYIEFEEVRN